VPLIELFIVVCSPKKNTQSLNTHTRTHEHKRKKRAGRKKFAKVLNKCTKWNTQTKNKKRDQTKTKNKPKREREEGGGKSEKCTRRLDTHTWTKHNCAKHFSCTIF